MLILSGAIINKPVLSLRLGNQIATATKPIINPNNLKIEGFYCIDRFDKKKSLILLSADIRENIPKGFVVNDHEVLSDPSDLLRIQDVIKINFELLGKHVVDVNKKKLGRVNDYATDKDSLYIQKIYVEQSVVRSLSGKALIIDRAQIVEITDKRIVIHDAMQRVAASAAAAA